MKSLVLFALLILSPALMIAEDIDAAIDLYGHGQYRRASDLLRDKEAKSPADAEIHLWLGKTYLKTQRWDEAVREFEAAVEREPNNAWFHLWLGRACGARASHANFLSAFSWARRVVKEFELARKLSPENLDVRYDLLEYYVEAPGIVGGGRDKAEAEVKAIAALDPLAGHVARARIYEKDGKSDQALAELVKAATRAPVRASTYADLANFLLKRQDFAGAEYNARKALSVDEKSPRARMLLAAAQIRLRQDLQNTERALKELVSGVLEDGDPTFEEVYYWLGEAYAAQGDKGKAERALKTALAFNPDFEQASEALSQSK